MVSPGGQGLWHPRGSGLLVAVLILSAVALVVHGGIALVLLRGTVHPSVADGLAAPAVTPTTAGSSPSGTTPTSSPSTSGATAPPNPAGTPLHLDHACLVADNPATSAVIPPSDPFGTEVQELGANAELQRLYAVKDGQLTAADGAGPVRDCDRQLWQLVVAATPPTVLHYLDELLIFDADLSGKSDSSVGEVTPKGADGPDPDPAHWRLALAPNGTTDLDVALTVAHEIGHLLSLNRGQMTGQNDKTCPGTYIDTGCLSDLSVLLAYLDDTWSDDTFKAFDTADSDPDQSKRDTALRAFYDDHASEFVDSYAATYPSEDFAESFAIWCAVGPQSPVLPDVIEGDPQNGAKKLAWFEQPGNPVAKQTQSQCEALRAFTR